MAEKIEKKQLNKEQLEAIKHENGPLLVIAGAGTGKTTVITERIKYLIESKLAAPSEILALTFTEKASREMEERVDVALPYGYTQMWISTFHSFCDRVLRREALHIGYDPKYKLMTQAETVQLLRRNLFKFDLNYFRPLGNPTKFIGGMIQHFSRLQDENITPREYLDWVRKKKRKVEISEEERFEMEKWLELANAYKIYEELKVKEGFLDFGDLVVKTIKLFRERPNILKEYQKQFKYILIDEFQDTNYAQNELSLLLSKSHKNITVVGDDDQCLPPDAKISTLGKDIKIKDIKVGDSVLTAVGKGHTSVSKVIRVFKKVRTTRFLTFKTEGGKKVEVTDNHKMFCFLPAHYDLRDWHFVYIMYHTNLGWRIGVTNNLPQRLRLERHADKIIGIGSYKTDEEAKFFEAYYSAKYGIPTVTFTPRPKQAIAGELLTRLFEDIDTRSNVLRLAHDLKIELDSPQFLVGAVTRGETRRVKINFEMCARNYRSKTHKDGFVGNPSVLHQVSLETSNSEILNRLQGAGISLLKARKGKRVRKNFADLKEAWSFVEKLERITGGIIDKRFKIGRFNDVYLPARIVPASQVFPGMYLPILKGKEIQYEKIVSREEKIKKSETYDLEIEKTHNFIADGVVVHNSIYRFRGAAVSNIVQFRKNFPKVKIVVLTKNYRSTQGILDKSYNLIQNNNPDRLEAIEKIDKKLVSTKKIKGDGIGFIHVARVENEGDIVAKKIKDLIKREKRNYRDFAILVRANNHAEPFTRALSRNGVPYQFLGPGRLFRQPEIIDLISYLKVLYNFEDSPSLYRLLSIEYFDISGRDLSAIGNYAKKYNLSLFESCEKIDDINVGSETREKIGKIIEIIKKHLKLSRRESAGQLLYYFLEDTGLLQKLLNPTSANSEKKAVNISKFFDKLKTYETDHEDATIPAVADWIDLTMEMGESPLAGDMDWTQVNAVNILTVHSSKGLEFPVVFLVNLTSGRFPTIERREQIPVPEELIKEMLPKGDYHLEEERRLFYVGMTRAKDRLFFTTADYYGEGKREKKISPFIFEALGDEIIGSEEKEKGEQLYFLDYSKTEERKESVPSLHIDYLSYSQIETFRVCPLHYKLRYILKVPTPPSSSQSFGISIHDTLKDFYLSIKGGKKASKRLILNILEENWIREGFTSKGHERKFFERARDYLSDYFEAEYDKDRIPVLLEQPFTVPLEDGNFSRPLKIGGKIDRVDEIGNGRIEIIDYKTGANIPTQKQVDHDMQLTFYALAAATIKELPFNKKPEEVKLTLYYFDNKKKISTVRTKSDLEKAKEEIFKIREQMEKSDFKCSREILCERCEYRLLCNSG